MILPLVYTSAAAHLQLKGGKPTISELMSIQNDQISVTVSLFHGKEQGKDVLL